MSPPKKPGPPSVDVPVAPAPPAAVGSLPKNCVPMRVRKTIFETSTAFLRSIARPPTLSPTLPSIVWIMYAAASKLSTSIVWLLPPRELVGALGVPARLDDDVARLRDRMASVKNVSVVFSRSSSVLAALRSLRSCFHSALSISALPVPTASSTVWSPAVICLSSAPLPSVDQWRSRQPDMNSDVVPVLVGLEAQPRVGVAGELRAPRLVAAADRGVVGCRGRRRCCPSPTWPSCPGGRACRAGTPSARPTAASWPSVATLASGVTSVRSR